MDKIPFSVYDFMGYLFPGVVFMYFFYSFCSLFSLNLYIPSNIGGDSIGPYLLFIIVSYLIGHIVSFLSSETIEKFSSRLFGYPSFYLLTPERDLTLKRLFCCRYFGRDSRVGKITRGCILIMLLPLALAIIILNLCGIIRHIVRPLTLETRQAIKAKQKFLADNLGIKDIKKRSDFHRVVMHYVYLNIPGSTLKTNNYIMLYGFLRSMSLIFCLVFLVYLLKVALPTISINESVNLSIVINLTIYYLISIFSFLGFMKFYRRFTIEDYMSLLTWEGKKADNSQPGQPTPPNQPTQPSQSAQSAQPAQSAQSTQSTQSTQSAQPAQSAQSTQSAQSVQPAQAAQSSQPTQPTQPTQSTSD